MRLILNQKTEGTTEVNTNILLTAIFNLSKNQDRLEFFLRNYRYQIITIKTKPANKAVDLGSFIRMNKTSDGVVKYFEGESLLSCGFYKAM